MTRQAKLQLMIAEASEMLRILVVPSRRAIWLDRFNRLTEKE